jgi:predicted 3-demethylubiquinone-9 3-methyltransferase (glyoxalase superfamily)
MNATKILALSLLLGLPHLLPSAPGGPARNSMKEAGRAREQELAVPAGPRKQKITPFLWFDGDAEEAVRFYLSIFEDSRLLSQTRWGEGGPFPAGTLLTATFQLAGREFMALNGGPQFRFTEAISLLVSCETQEEVDEFWEKLTAGGEPGRCGWLADKYGLSWQIVPTVLGKLMQDEDPEKARRVVQAMMEMGKLDIRRLEQAHAQR